MVVYTKYMGLKTFEVQLENGCVKAVGNEPLPAKAQGTLTVPDTTPAKTCGELAERWKERPRMSIEEASAFADDIGKNRAALRPLEWD